MTPTTAIRTPLRLTVPQALVIVWCVLALLDVPAYCAEHLPSIVASAAQTPGGPFQGATALMAPFANLYRSMHGFYDSSFFHPPVTDAILFVSVILPGVVFSVFRPEREGT